MAFYKLFFLTQAFYTLDVTVCVIFYNKWKTIEKQKRRLNSEWKKIPSKIKSERKNIDNDYKLNVFIFKVSR